jgi:phage/plasmid-associated DNA primase
MLVWGTSAGNGKSLLWGDIMDLLLGGKKGPFYATVTTSALAEGRTGNNDEIYNLNGKRYGFLSEPRKGKAMKMDAELIKNLTGDKSITAEAKYKNAITFNLMCKFAMACNTLPDMNYAEGGLKRRTNVLEQNTAFLDSDMYAEAPQHLKDEGKVKIKDDAFINELIKNGSLNLTDLLLYLTTIPTYLTLT